ncbi:MAG: hypothetical protein K2X81_08305, partial [Candidatus Obscuribacterales bacterium]|nr:hypothetical protein [Candidatus Obscuribacterales bacterium]
NTLSVGYGTKAPDSVDIALQGLMDYNGKTAEQILAIRSKNVNAHPELISGTYAATPNVLALDSKSAWWSTKGYTFRANGGAGSLTEGASRESASLGNPYLLVSPEWYLTIMNIPRTRFPKDADFARVFPTYVPPTSVKIFAKEKREEVTYNVMEYYNNIHSMLNDEKISSIQFDLHTYNAKDFGYNYIYIEPGTSTNLNKYPPDVFENTQGLAVRTSKSCAPSCNDLVGTPAAVTDFQLTNLPAKCHMLLWRAKPSSHLMTPDFKIDLNFN